MALLTFSAASLVLDCCVDALGLAFVGERLAASADWRIDGWADAVCGNEAGHTCLNKARTHTGIHGNDKADRLDKEATDPKMPIDTHVTHAEIAHENMAWPSIREDIPHQMTQHQLLDPHPTSTDGDKRPI